MKKFYYFMIAALVVISSGCKNTTPVVDPIAPDPTKPSVQEVLTPEESKEKLMSVAKGMLGKFNTEDQKAAFELSDVLYEKYRDYSWRNVQSHIENYESYFEPIRYMEGVTSGQTTPTEAVHTFSFANESVVFEADDETRTWKNMGPASDNSIIFRCKDDQGNTVEAKIWGEGKTKEYEYEVEDWHWGEAPRVYNQNVYQEGYNYEDGHYYYFDPNTGKYYYNDWEHQEKIIDGVRLYRGVLPAKICFTFKQGSKELMRYELSQELEKNNHAYFTVLAKVTNLSWTVDVKINSTNGSAAFAFLYGNDRLFSAAINLPSYKLIDKEDSVSYEDWIEQYAERYEELIQAVGSADGGIDLAGEVQVRVKIDNVGYAYRDFNKWSRDYSYYSKEGAEKLCNLINENQTNGLYYNSDVLQAKVLAQVGQRSWQDYQGNTQYDYYPEAVLFFPSDSTTYSIGEYFDRKPFTDLQYTVEDLANAYIKLSKLLYDEIGEIRF